ncbi:hypothetical protein [Nocardioides marmorisolisilvae]|uniref:Uncharacterized protein n=1 Tax=Nocardioides marmorisolisilvae TaxID=1542737 RepID=A0A3N0DPU5_9ACTN|nr:hypothetical protein [Nocardioides marmorisolisilvae]RNL77678.1 hypothetical protein EFL95_16870 [Nocardioides marmorisolisilvae]
MRFTRARVIPVLMIALTGAGVVALQSPASADVSTTTITSPLDGAHYLVDDAHSDPVETVTVTGTSDGTTGDTVDIRCFGVAGSRDWNGGAFAVPVQVDGTFSAEMPITAAKASCRLRAVPDSFTDGASLAAFSGPTITTEYLTSTKVASGPHAGMTYDFDAVFQGSKAWNEFHSVGRGGLFGSQLSYPGGISSNYLWSGAAAGLPHRSGAVRSAVRIDGKDAFSPYTAQAALNFVDRPGAPALTYSAQRDASGVVTIRETDPYVLCSSVTTYPPDPGACPEFKTAGVQLERTYTTADSDRQVRVRDVWRSTDGKAHSISGIYVENVNTVDAQSGESTVVGMKLGHGGYFTDPDPQITLTAPWPLANSAELRESNTAPDGDLYVPRGAVTFGFPTGVQWEQNGLINLVAASIRVPGGDYRLIRQSFVIGTTDAEVLAKAKVNQSLITPYRPDAWIRPAGGTYQGNNVFNTTGAGQTVAGKRTFLIVIQNDGSGSDRIRIRGAAHVNGFGATYLKGATGHTSITYAVTHSDYVVNLAPRSFSYLRLVVRPPSSAHGQGATFPFTLMSLNNAYRRDVVAAQVQMPIS